MDSNPYSAPIEAQLVEEKSRKPSTRRGLKMMVVLFFMAVNALGVTAIGTKIYIDGDTINWAPFIVICSAMSSLYWAVVLGLWIAVAFTCRLLNPRHSADS